MQEQLRRMNMSQESVNSLLWDATPCAGKKRQSAIAELEELTKESVYGVAGVTHLLIRIWLTRTTFLNT
ncbi:MAG: hypothetical protein ACYT04_44395 [Nostoc sp.]